MDEDALYCKFDIVPAEPLEMGNTSCVLFVHNLLFTEFIVQENGMYTI